MFAVLRVSAAPERQSAMVLSVPAGTNSNATNFTLANDGLTKRFVISDTTRERIIIEENVTRCQLQVCLCGVCICGQSRC